MTKVKQGYIVSSCKKCEHYDEDWDKNKSTRDLYSPEPCIYCRRWHEDYFMERKE